MGKDDLARALAERRRQWAAFNAWEAEEKAKRGREVSIAERIAWYADAYEFAKSFRTSAASARHLQDLLEWLELWRRAWRAS